MIPKLKKLTFHSALVIALLILISCSSSGDGSTNVEQTKEDVKNEQIVPGETVINGKA